jgi:hypothetical protein
VKIELKRETFQSEKIDCPVNPLLNAKKNYGIENTTFLYKKYRINSALLKYALRPCYNISGHKYLNLPSATSAD